jgi:hypothetical protein
LLTDIVELSFDGVPGNAGRRSSSGVCALSGRPLGTSPESPPGGWAMLGDGGCPATFEDGDDPSHTAPPMISASTTSTPAPRKSHVGLPLPTTA